MQYCGYIVGISLPAIEWDAVVPVTNYIVEYRTSAQPSWSDARRLPSTISTMSQLQGLEANTQYIVRVIILNNCTQQVTPEVTLTTGREYCISSKYQYHQYAISSKAPSCIDAEDNDCAILWIYRAQQLVNYCTS